MTADDFSPSVTSLARERHARAAALAARCPDLKPGDRVRCVEPDSNWLREGATYAVAEVWNHIGVPTIGLESPGALAFMLWGAWRFEKVAAVAAG